jgi:hypothetical protein
MIAPVANVAEELAEPSPELSDGTTLATASVYRIAYTLAVALSDPSLTHVWLGFELHTVNPSHR